MVEVNSTKTARKGAVNNGGSKSLSVQILDAIQLIADILLLLVYTIYTYAESLYRLFVPPPVKSVQGEIVLITGAGHGMGKELALLYASNGATVVGWDINMKDNNEVISEIKERGFPKAHAYYCDVSSRDNVLEVAKKVQEEVGDVTILINNAGIMPTHPILEQTQREIEKMFQINVLAHFWTIQAFLPTMKKNNKGHIIALSSVAGLFGLENLVPYCGSKFAVRGIMEALHEELRMDKNCEIKLTTICPYMVDTGLCKRPKVRFEKAMALLTPTFAAESIMRAQRTDQAIVSIPKYILPISSLARVMPLKASMFFKDFLNTGVESDL